MTRMEESRIADRLWADYARTGDPHTREAIIHQFERLAYSIANRFTRKGTESDDLFQVALVGLVKAVDRFDPSTRYRFSTFATPTILGELRRYFRDHSWSVHVPRGMQEFAQQTQRARRELTETLGRSPTTMELAGRLGATEERVLEALSLEEVNRPLSLDGEFEQGDSQRPALLEQCLGQEDAALDTVERQVSMSQALSHLGAPLREVLQLRYVQGLSQREVARRKGLTQMQVSRLEKRAMAEMRAQFGVH